MCCSGCVTEHGNAVARRDPHRTICQFWQLDCTRNLVESAVQMRTKEWYKPFYCSHLRGSNNIYSVVAISGKGIGLDKCRASRRCLPGKRSNPRYDSAKDRRFSRSETSCSSLSGVGAWCSAPFRANEHH